MRHSIYRAAGIGKHTASPDIAVKISNMKYVFMILGASILFAACTNGEKETAKAPLMPKSVQDVTGSIKGKKYKVDKLGILSPFASDSLSPVNWKIQQQDTSKFFRDYAAKQTAFTVDFNNDSLASFRDGDAGKMINAVYSVENEINPEDEEEQPGIKIKLVYNDSMEFGGNKTAAKMTLKLRVMGVDAGNLLLETNRSYNNRKLVLWMKGQQ
jgi:hypothetical protein